MKWEYVGPSKWTMSMTTTITQSNTALLKSLVKFSILTVYTECDGVVNAPLED